MMKSRKLSVLEELERRGDITRKDGRGVLPHLVQQQGQTNTSRQLIDGRVFTDSHQNIFGLFNPLYYLLLSWSIHIVLF
jgi:hypothetical protein